MTRRRGSKTGVGHARPVTHVTTKQLRSILKEDREHSQEKVVEGILRYLQLRVQKGHHQPLVECPVARIVNTRQTEHGEAYVAIDSLGNEHIVLHQGGCDIDISKGYPAFRPERKVAFKLGCDDLIVVPPHKEKVKPFFASVDDVVSYGFGLQEKRVTLAPAN